MPFWLPIKLLKIHMRVLMCRVKLLLGGGPRTRDERKLPFTFWECMSPPTHKLLLPVKAKVIMNVKHYKVFFFFFFPLYLESTSPHGRLPYLKVSFHIDKMNYFIFFQKMICSLRNSIYYIFPWSTIVYYDIVMWTSVACAVGPSVTTSSTDFSFQNLVFWNLFELSVAEIT